MNFSPEDGLLAATCRPGKGGGWNEDLIPERSFQRGIQGWIWWWSEGENCYGPPQLKGQRGANIGQAEQSKSESDVKSEDVSKLPMEGEMIL